MKYLKLLFVFSLLLLSTYSYAQSANSLYVDINNPNCSDSISKSNVTESNPWCSIGRAAWGSTERNSPNSSQAAGAGDTVIIKPGIYWTNGGNGRFDVALNPVNNGNANNPITFRGEGLVYVRMIQGPRGPMIGCNSRSYIIWDNFQIDDYYGGSTGDTGPIHFGGTHCQLLNSDIKGHPGSYYHGYATFGANYRGVSFEYGHFNIIKNNRIYNFTGGQNEAGIMMYNSDDNIIENNEIYNNGVGIFVKGYHNWNGTGPFQARNVIRNNLLYGNTHSSIRVLGANDTKVYQNVMYNCGVGLWAGFFNSTRSLFVNNTVSNCNVGILSQGNELEDVSFYNNVINSSSHAAIVTSNDISDQDVEYNRNIYFNNQRMLCNDWAGGCAAANLSQFQVLGKDPDSLEVNPLFVDANSRNFRLQASSPALALGRSILSIHGASGQTIPAGAYITGNEVIGLNTNGAPTPPPPPPSDTTPPTISSISVSNITTTGATVSWTTNESATSQLQYGPSTSYGSVTNSNGTTNHTVTLSNLTSNTTYNFRVSATDTSNNNSLSTNQTFTTAQEVVTPPSTPASTVDLRANNSTSNITITADNTFTLSWTSTNATGCTVTPGNFTGTNGTQTLSPTATTTYSASCTGTGGNSTDTITVNVSPQPTTPPPPTTTPTTFTSNQRVQTTANLNVRATANGTLLGTQPQGTLGTIVGTGVTVSGTNWWNVNYDSGVDGWSAEQFLQSYTAPTTPTTPPTGTPTPTGSGKYLYVSPTGDDSVTYANNNASNPWRTIGRAAWGSTNRSSPNSSQAAKAGDVVIVNAGTYTTSEAVNNRFIPVYNPVNEGTIGNYINFVCLGNCILGAQYANSPVIGSFDRDYIKWFADVSQGHLWNINSYGLQSGNATLTQVNTTPDTGPVVCAASNNCWIEGARIDGGAQIDYTDNWNGIRLENCTSCVIRNNDIRNFNNASNGVNGSAITIYGSANAIIEYNYANNMATGLMFKDTGSTLPQNNVHVRYNIFENIYSWCLRWSVTSEDRNYVYQNICTNSVNGVGITGGGLSNDWIFNNTFYNLSGVGLMPTSLGYGGRFWNNIISGVNAVIYVDGTMPSESVIDLEHNVYHAYSNRFYQGYDGNPTFNQYLASYGQDQAVPSSIISNPLFVSSTNFRLQPSSPARSIGVDLYDLDGDGSTTDIIPAGAYITGNEIIGINTNGVSNPTPPAPSPSTPTTPPPPTPTPQPTPTPTPTPPSGGAPAPTTPQPDPKPISTQPDPKPTPTVNIPKPTLARTVYIGSQGDDVTQLQTFLINIGLLAPNLNTGYFGPATKEAVQKYQCNYMQICSGTEATTGYGMVGQKTRASISGTTLPTPSTPTTGTLTAEQRAAIQKQINDLLLLVQQLLIQLRALQGN